MFQDPGRLTVVGPDLAGHPGLLDDLRRHATVEVIGHGAPAAPGARVRLGGTLSVFTSPALAAVVAAAADGTGGTGGEVEIRVDEVVFVGARACRALVDATRAFRRRGGTVVLTGGRPSVCRVMQRHLAGVTGIRLA